MPFIPHTEKEIKEMLAAIGVADIDALFAEIPADLRAAPFTQIPSGISELELTREMQEIAAKNQLGINFIGAGAYEHFIPAAVWDIASRGEFMTAYTPYQAEASQGTLQLIYEFQSMITQLTGMDVANASLYDGASAMSEAILMAVRANKRSKAQRILIPASVNPFYRATAKTTIGNQNIELIEIPFSEKTGTIDVALLENYANEEITALIIPQPNFFGTLEEVDQLTRWAHQKSAMVIGVVNPLSLAILEAPGLWGEMGADIVCGEGQSFGVPLASGGPYFGFMCCKEEFVRQMPGRIVGRTTDIEGKQGFALTLQAREQHIRRGKATSNICTNQGLLVTAATIYLSLMGPEGLRRIANKSHENTRELVKQLTKIPGVELVFPAPYFHEAVLRLPKSANEVLNQLSENGIQGGFSLTQDYPQLGECILVCATETKNAADIEKYAEALQKVLK